MSSHCPSSEAIEPNRSAFVRRAVLAEPLRCEILLIKAGGHFSVGELMSYRFALIAVISICFNGSLSAQQNDYLQLAALQAKLKAATPKDKPLARPFVVLDSPKQSIKKAAQAALKDTATNGKGAVPMPVANGGSLASQAASKWVNSFADGQALFDKESIKEMQNAIRKLPQEDVAQWLEETADLRAAIESDDWVATNDWLQRFWRVQAFYSDEQVAAFQSQLNTLPPDHVLIVMTHFTKHVISRAISRRRSTAARQLPLVAPGRTAPAPINNNLSIRRPQSTARAPRSRRERSDQSLWIRNLDTYRRFTPR